MVTLELVEPFGNQEDGGRTAPARFRILKDGAPVSAAEWLDGAVGEFRHPANHVLRRYFSHDDGGMVVASRDFSHLGEQEMTDLLAHLLAALQAAERNGERLVKANERLQRALGRAVEIIEQG